jgi:FAD/FMN-containing dehydrogenase
LFSRSHEELRLYRAIKDSFDPEGLLNPGKIIDL